MTTRPHGSTQPVEPLVSVAIVTYNHGLFVEEALRSVLDQDYSNIEIIVADDASSDDTVSRVREIANQTSRTVKVLTSSLNRGVTANHTIALEACSGDYIAWLGGDDVMFPTKITKQVKLMESDPNCAICYHDLEMFVSETGVSLGNFSKFDGLRSGGIEVLAQYGAINGGSSNMVRAISSPRAFDHRVPRASDWLYYVQCLSDGKTIRCIPEILGRYRQHEAGVTKSSAPIDLYKDHLVSCALIVADRPDLHRQIRKRTGGLLRTMRNCQGEWAYRKYLSASLAQHFRLSTFVALLASYVGVRR